MALKLKTAPTTTPVTLAEVKQHCRAGDFTDDDAMLQIYLDAAVALLDGYSGIMGRCLVSQVWELYYDAFPCEDLKIPLGDLISVGPVEYVDPDSGTYTTWTADNYEVDSKSLDGWIVPVSSWPTPMETVNAVRVTFTAGYGAAADVPAALKAAILLLVQYWYENPNADKASDYNGLPPAVKALIAPFRRISI
jgi:uncharacterized phiE125 gp8 family phage protein